MKRRNFLATLIGIPLLPSVIDEARLVPGRIVHLPMDKLTRQQMLIDQPNSIAKAILEHEGDELDSIIEHLTGEDRKLPLSHLTHGSIDDQYEWPVTNEEYKCRMQFIDMSNQ